MMIYLTQGEFVNVVHITTLEYSAKDVHRIVKNNGRMKMSDR